MARTRQSAKKAGTTFERQIADYLAAHYDDRIDRRTKTGNKDRGDISGMRHMGGRIVVEIKNCARTELGTWMSEAETERGNDDATACMVISKRHGRGQPGDQWVHMTVRDLVALLTGSRPQ
ncbi:MAG: hypothetical protein QM286_08240 [Acidobacteriota bacterium]|nr:hypothetical protein [Acidobacteriota bacterium]